MAKITFHHADGNVDVLDVEPGTSLMRAAVTNGVDGIVGECGGQAMCATCHVYVRAEYLDGAARHRRRRGRDARLHRLARATEPASRLGCQITVGDGLDDIEVDVPDDQV